LKLLAAVAAVALILSAIILFWALRILRRVRVPANADFFTTVRAVPLSLMVRLDLLDLALEVLSTPIIWVILSRFRLQALRNAWAGSTGCRF